MKISLSIFNLLLLCTDTESLPFSVLTTEERQQLFPPVLPAFVRFCKAFPPLMEDVVGLLLQYGRICASEDSLQPLTSIHCKFISRRKSAKNVIYFFFFSEQSKYVWKMQQERVIFLLLIGSFHSSEIKSFILYEMSKIRHIFGIQNLMTYCSLIDNSIRFLVLILKVTLLKKPFILIFCRENLLKKQQQ